MKNYDFNLGKILREWKENFSGRSDIIFTKITLKMTKIWEKNTMRYEELNSKNHESIGEVLKCHLLIEYYLNELLVNISPENPFADFVVNNPFSKKVKFLKKFYEDDDAMINMLESINELNEIRNKYSHDITFAITKSNLTKILNYLHKIHIEINTEMELVKLIKEFSSSMCTILPVYYGETNKAFIDEVNQIKNKSWEEIYNS
jgi:ABC-type transport system involved in multi-copper enzyme maturation permease subunit